MRRVRLKNLGGEGTAEGKEGVILDDGASYRRRREGTFGSKVP